MQHKPVLEVAKLAVRSTICPKCYQRPFGSESLGPAVARSCEPRCSIFLSLPQIETAIEQADPNLSPDGVMRRFVCQTCTASPTAGDYCAEGLARTCPLSRYAGELLQVLSSIPQR